MQMGNQVLLLFNIGGAELFFIVLVIIMFFGSKKIPELARGLGKGMRELKNATSEIQQEIKDSTKDLDKIKNSVNVEHQVKELISDSKTEDENIADNQQDKVQQPSQPNTVSRSSAYSTNKTTSNEK